MTEKMLLAIEAGIWRVLHSALRRADAMYPNRDSVDSEYALHLKAVQVILAWHESQVAAVLKMRMAARPGRRPGRPQPRPDTPDDCDEWDDLLGMIFGGVAASWMMSVGLSALPYDLRLMLVQMTHVLELAIAGENARCLNELQDLVRSLAPHSGDRTIGGKSVSPVPIQVKDKQRIERESQLLADRFKKMIQPKPTLRTSRGEPRR